MYKVKIGVYSVKGKLSGKELGYIRFRLKDDSSDPVPMSVDKGDMYVRTPLRPTYTTYTDALETGLDFYMTYIMDDLELTIIDIYEVYTW
jgi:hypothetical protein